MDNAKESFYTEEDYYNTPENVRCELINGNLNLCLGSFQQTSSGNTW